MTINDTSSGPLTIDWREWILFIALLLCTPLSASPESTLLTDTQQWEKLSTLMDQAEANLKNETIDNTTLVEITRDALNTGKYALECIDRNEAELAKITESINSLGKTPLSRNLSKAGRKLTNDKQRIEEVLAQCRLLNLRSSDLQEKVRHVGQGVITRRLLTREKNIIHHALKLLEQPERLQQESTELLDTFSRLKLKLNLPNIYLALAYGLVGMLMGFIWSDYKHRQYRKQTPNIVETSPALATLWNSLTRTAPMLIFAGLVKLSFHFNSPGPVALNKLADALVIFTISYAILRAMLRPRHPLSGFTPLVPNTSKKLFYWVRLLLVMSFFGTLLQAKVFDGLENNHLINLMRLTVGTLAGLALIRIIWLLRKHLPIIKQFYLQLLGAALILVAIAALWLGYNHLSLFLFQGTIGTLSILLIGWMLIRVPVDIFDGLDEGRAVWQQQLRNKMGLDEKQIVPGLIWLRLVHLLLVGSMIITALLYLWGMSQQTFTVIITQINNGIELGGLLLKPAHILSAMLVTALLINLTQIVKRNLSRSWLQRTSLSRSAREATVTITGYVGNLFAIFIGLSIVGLNFTNLAIIAGALSVGIGFGLQNIVNNFISGLILLFERPVRRGDWVKVGTTEGYVKDISIRSTIIQTFDRADIIVPNSDLISNQVTNMMLSNQYGRVIIPIRVAYGEDPERVTEVLLKVAEAHPATLREFGVLKSQAIFRSFGEYAMNFELRCHIRDVEEILIVTSELNISISKALREAGINMPYPHQVVQLQGQANQTRTRNTWPIAENLTGASKNDQSAQ